MVISFKSIWGVLWFISLKSILGGLCFCLKSIRGGLCFNSFKSISAGLYFISLKSILGGLCFLFLEEYWGGLWLTYFKSILGTV